MTNVLLVFTTAFQNQPIASINDNSKHRIVTLLRSGTGNSVTWASDVYTQLLFLFPYCSLPPLLINKSWDSFSILLAQHLRPI